MAAIGDRVFDNGIGVLNTEATHLHILSADPGLTFANIATYTLGNKSSYTTGAPADRAGGGREVTAPAITDGSVTGTDTATHFAIIDNSNSRVLASAALASSQAVTSGNTFTLTSFTIGIPDPA